MAWLGRWTAADPAGTVDGVNLYRSMRNNPIRFSDPDGMQSRPHHHRGATIPKPDQPLNVGPLKLSNLTITGVTGFASFKANLTGLFSKNPSVSIPSASIQGGLTLRSDVSIPSLGLSGAGNYKLDLGRIQLEQGKLSALVGGKLSLFSGPLRLDVSVRASGTTTVDDPIYLSRFHEHLEHLGANAKFEFHAAGDLSIYDKEIGNFRLSGSTTGNLQGPLSFSGSLHLGKLQLLEATGSGQFSPNNFALHGEFSTTLPPLAVARGTFSFDASKGFSAQGHYFGVLVPGLNGLSSGINPTAPTPGATVDTSGAKNIPTYSLEPSVGLGYTYFNVSPQHSVSATVGASFRSEFVPYFQGGASQPFSGPSGGAYFGGAVRGSF